MVKHNNSGKRSKAIALRVTTAALVLVMLVQLMGFGVSAMIGGLGTTATGGLSTSVNGIYNFESDEVIAELKRDLIKSLNKDLVMKIEDQQLSGPVDVIVTFSDGSIVSSFASSKDSEKMSLKDFRFTSKAAKLEQQLLARQTKVLDKLYNEGIIDAVRYNYLNVMDGACVSTTYEKLDALCNAEGVERVMLSNRYEAMAAVENPVDVYETGIFNSSQISYTGKGTIVAILDTGCDYNHSAFTSYTVKSPLYDRDDIAALLDKTMAYGYAEGLEAREVYYGNITGGKIAFGYDYADKDYDIMPFENSHGTHVAGIIGGKDDNITGVAIDTQFAIMKVFSDYETGAEDADILAALEDSIILGVDAINMSLGSSCGFSREADDQYKNDLYDNIQKAGISLVVAASNDHSSGFGSENGNTNKTDNPDSATLGTPSTYDASMSVASINGKKDKYMLANGEKVVFYIDSYDTGADQYDLFEMLGIKEGEKVTYEYVAVPGVGMAVNYAGIDVKGKVALVQRGDITFEEKVQFAQEAGAVAVVIYNNVFGDITMTIGNFAKIPAVSIGKDEGEALAALSTGTIEFDLSNQAGPFMSDFSSWGPTPDLKLKPEITAHGGNIYSSTVGNEYDEMSGTSMAAPNMCGITVLIRQYVKERYPEYSACEVRDMVNELTMSTATIALDKNGNPYSPRKQGAGIADIFKSTTTPAYLYVEDLGKTKLELGDDPERTGVYEMPALTIKNISDKAQSYRLGAIAMTESVSTSEPDYVAEMAYLLAGTTDFTVSGATYKDGVLTVAAGATATIVAKLTLTKEDKAYLNSHFANGMYVEGYLTFDNIEEKGVDLNCPYLAFYGDWGEAPLFDLDYYEVETEAHNNAIDEDDKIKADYYATTPLGSYYYDYILPLGTYVYNMDESEYTAIPAERDRAAVSYFADSISGIYGVFCGLLRGAKEMTISIVDTSTGEVVWEKIEYNCYKSHYSGAPRPYAANFNLPMADFKTGEIFGGNNSKYEVTMEAKLDWDGGDNDSDTFSFSFYIDYQAPTVVDATYRTEYDKGREENRYYLDLIVYDNHYAMSCRPVVVYEVYDDFKERNVRTYSMLCENPIPIYQEERGSTSKVTIEITDYIDIIADCSMPNGVTVYLDDYAMNGTACYIPFPETDSEDLEFAESEITLDINQVADLTQLFLHADSAEPVETDYLKTLKWSIANDDGTVKLSDGKIQAMKEGTATIKVTSDSWVTPTLISGKYVNVPIYKTLIVHVSDTVVDDPLSGDNVLIEGLKFTSFETLFAFPGDIDWSAIGSTGSTHYLTDVTSTTMYPSEKIKLSYKLEPWNLSDDRYELKWSSSNPNVATVNDQGEVTAESEGRARITLQITVDGKPSLLQARLTVEVKSEFVIENRTLIAYKGKGGDVVIPDDEGIMYIGSFAFAHYNLDNEKEVEKDEDGYYDLDLKKEPIGNNTVTSVVIPENVEAVQKYAFYNCIALESVVLPTSCKLIEGYAFYSCDNLTDVNFDRVKVIGNYAFADCKKLTCENLGGANLSAVYSMGDYAFRNVSFTKIDLSGLSRIGTGVFYNCSKLTDVTLGKRTRVLDEMFKNTAIKSIVIYGDMVADSAFMNCKSLESVVIKNDVTYVGDSAFLGCTALESFTAEGVVENISDYAFYGCSALESFTLPNCELVLGDAVFGNTGIKTLTFGANTVISSAGMYVFSGVDSVNAILTDSASYKLVDGVVFSKDGKKLVMVMPSATLTAYEIPAGVEEICDGAFSSASKLTSITLADGSALKAIGDYAFASCTNLTYIELPASAFTVGDYAFYNNYKLTGIDLSGATAIGKYAFTSSALTNVNMPKSDIVIGDSAFSGCTSLKTVTLGAGVTIGEYAFGQHLNSKGQVTKSSARVESVELLGDATVGAYAFFGCNFLTSFDFGNVIGKIGDFAFAGCSKLTSIVAPKVTELGTSAFSDCTSISTFSMESLKVMGNSALAPLAEGSTYANYLKSVYLPNLEKIGETAFFGCVYLESIDISKVTEIGFAAFGYCASLKTMTLSPDLKELPEMMFYECKALVVPDLSNIEIIGEGAFYSVNLPSELRLDNVIVIGPSAFYNASTTSNLTAVYAPKVQEIGAMAFAGCVALKTVSAPSLVKIGDSAFAYTGIKEFEVSESLNEVGLAVFDSCPSFIKFVATVDGEKVDNAEVGNVKIVDGVLYRKVVGGYELVCCPQAKDVTAYEVAEGTVKIAFCAFYNNKSLEMVILPSTLKYIANFAFKGCDSLDTVVFKSYYAPVLEGTMSGDAISITPSNKSDYPGFDELYRYDYTFREVGMLSIGYYYGNFKGTVGSKDAQGITAQIPENCVGYDTLIYNAFFDFSEQSSGVTAGKYAVDFIDAAGKLPEVATRYDKLVVQNAIVAYNALLGHSEELQYVSNELIARYEKACSEYYVDVVEDLIAHLFDMNADEYSFNLVKEANDAYLALSDADREMVANKDVLDAKIAALAEEFGCEIDFSKTYQDHLNQEQPPVDDPIDDNDGMQTWVIVLIVALAAVAVAGAAVVVFIFIKKKRA